MPASDQGLHGQDGLYRWVPTTLSFLTCRGHVLLLKGAPDKKRWANRYNGVGGGVKRGEDVYAAAEREIEEETRLRPERLQLCGIVHIEVGSTGKGMFTFRAEVPERVHLPETAEGLLEWVLLEEVPLKNLVDDLPDLLPRILHHPADAPPFFARYFYDADDRLRTVFR